MRFSTMDGAKVFIERLKEEIAILKAENAKLKAFIEKLRKADEKGILEILEMIDENRVFKEKLAAIRKQVEDRLKAEKKGKERHDKWLRKLRAGYKHKDGAKRKAHELTIKTRARILVLGDILKILGDGEVHKNVVCEQPKTVKNKTVCPKCGTYIGECGGWACKCDLPKQKKPKPSKKKAKYDIEGDVMYLEDDKHTTWRPEDD